MSSVKLTLRQPPNVDFVHGFPGIPAGVNRPHASIKGLVELRVGAGHPIKAKYIKVELRKVEILPGGGPTNTFTDVVGTGSFNVWAAKEEWEVISTQDIPFNIRIPETVPPSVALENGGGIRYELAAEICLKSKKGLFRRDAAPIRETTAPIVIDKHELHSAWPAYLKPDIRDVEKDGFQLTVERYATCYGPGDRVAMKCTIKSTSGTGAIRSYEMALRETAIFRRGPNSGTKSNVGPTVRSTFVGSEKLPVRVVIRPGLTDTVELKCTIPASHTTTTVVTAQHIEIVYSVAVRATLEGGGDLVIDNMPVMMSNWPRNVSEATVKQIGYAPSLSLHPPPDAASDAPARPASIAGTPPPARNQPRQQRPYSIAERVGSGSSGAGSPSVASQTLPAGGVRPASIAVDDFGSYSTNGNPVEKAGFQQPNTFAGHSGITQIPEESEPAGSVTGSAPLNTNTGSENSSSNKPKPSNRYTIVNADDSSTDQPYVSALEEKNRLKQQLEAEEQQGNGGTSNTAPLVGGRPLKGWLPADQEKRKQQEQSRRYQEAKKVAEDVQSAAVASLASYSPHPTTASIAPTSPASTPSAISAVPLTSPATANANPGGPKWMSAEEEKHQRLFNEAQDRARRAQAQALLNSPVPAAAPALAANVRPTNVVQNYQNPSPKPVSPAPQQQQPQQPQQHSTSPPPMNVIRQNPAQTPPQNVGKPSAGASLYQSAMMSIHPQNAPQVAGLGTPPRAPATTQTPSPPPQGSGYLAKPPIVAYNSAAQFAQHTGGGGGSSSAAAAPTGAPKPYVSAEEEKAQMRYLDAKRAVEQRQQNPNAPRASSPPASSPAPAAAPVLAPTTSAPVPYEQLFGPPVGPTVNSISPAPSNRVASPVQAPPPPPPVIAAAPTPPPASAPAPNPPVRTMSAMSAGEDGYRRHMNPLEAIASLSRNEGGARPTPPPRRQTPSMYSPMSPPPSGGHAYSTSESAASGYIPAGGSAAAQAAYRPPQTLTAEQEKAQLRARYDESNTGGGAGAVSGGSSGGTGSGRVSAAPAPLPPGAAPPIHSQYRPPQGLTAEQEKAQLRSRYEEGSSSSSPRPAASPAPAAAPAVVQPPPPPPADLAPSYAEPNDRPLNATEEKARLAAQYAADDVYANQSPGYGAPPPSSMSPPPPPPPAFEQQQGYNQWQQSPQQQQQYYNQQQYQQPPPPPQTQYTQSPSSYTNPLPPQQLYQQFSAPTPPPAPPAGPELAAPVATRPPMPTNFSQSTGMASPDYQSQQQQPHTAGTYGYPGQYDYSQQPQPLQSPTQYYTESPVVTNGHGHGNSNGNGNGYLGSESGFSNGGNVYNPNNGSPAPHDYASGYLGDTSGSRGLKRDPSVSQGKRRAVEEDIRAPPPPPPLAPRPPVEYVHETVRMGSTAGWEQEQHGNGREAEYNPEDVYSAGADSKFSLEVRPLSPLDLSFDHQSMPFERPPLPPKVPI